MDKCSGKYIQRKWKSSKKNRKKIVAKETRRLMKAYKLLRTKMRNKEEDDAENKKEKMNLINKIKEEEQKVK